jgi:CDP-6-deoxy-D-xylo-4-hexulose-3-dehydrase
MGDGTSTIQLASDTITPVELMAAADWVLAGNRLTKGEQTLEFEREFASYVVSRYSVFVNSGSSANLLVAAALKESGRLKNLKIVCPAVSWVTTVTPFLHLGFEVILCDSSPNDLGVNVSELRDIFVRESPSALAIVHVLGHPNKMEEIKDLCREFDVVLFEDTCEALGTRTLDSNMLGTSGLAGTFSFYYGHHISTIEGGMVVTDDFEFYQLMLSLRSHGWSRDLEPSVKAKLQKEFEVDEFRNFYTFYWPGFNFRSTDLQAYIGRGQLNRMEEIVLRRASNHKFYSNGLQQFWAQESDYLVLSSFAYGTAVRNRSEVAQELAKAGIESRPLICGNLARHPFWLKSNPPVELPLADFVHDYGMYLPNHASLGQEDVERVIDVFTSVAEPHFPN